MGFSWRHHNNKLDIQNNQKRQILQKDYKKSF